MNESEDNDIIASFIIQACEILDSTESSFKSILAYLDKGNMSDANPELFHQLFRVFHTIKGVSSFLNFNVVLNVAHKAEYLLDVYRHNVSLFDRYAFKLLSQTVDDLRMIIEKIQLDLTDFSSKNDSELLIKELDKLLAIVKEGRKPDDSDNQKQPNNKIEISGEVLEKFCKECLDIIESAEHSLLLYHRNPLNMSLIEDLFRSLHSFKGNCGFVGLGKLEAFSHRIESLIGRHQLDNKAFPDDVCKVLMECLDLMRESVKYLFEHQEEVNVLDSPLYSKIASFTSQEVNLKENTAIAESKKVIEDIEVKKEELKEPEQVDGLSDNPSFAKKNLDNQRKDIRVDMSKLDSFQNLVGELLIAKEMILHNPDLQNLKLPSLVSSLDRLTRIANSLQDVSISVRMVPASTVFSKMNRIVRDVSRKTGKDIRLEILGEETEIDKIVLDLVADPLVHIIRNACDHGIEVASDRIKKGKDKSGRVILSAEQKNDKIVISVQDDGKGLDKDFIFKKAVEKGLAQENAVLTENEIYQFLFMPGFSTAEKITDVSGRGVGLDVVLNNIRQAKGKVKIDTKLGEGTKFEISIPLTLATVDVMLVKVGDTTFSMPVSIINEAYKVSNETIIKRPDGLEFIKIRNEMYEIVPLFKEFNIESACNKPALGVLILVELNKALYAILVDKILYQTQTVIKGLSSYLKSVKSVSGFNILGNGEVSLIINFEELLNNLRK